MLIFLSLCLGIRDAFFLFGVVCHERDGDGTIEQEKNFDFIGEIKSMKPPPILFILGKIGKTHLFRKTSLLKRRFWIRELIMHRKGQKLNFTTSLINPY